MMQLYLHQLFIILKSEEKIKLYKKIYDCLKEHGQFINCDKIALTQEIEDEQLYELEHNIEKS